MKQFSIHHRIKFMKKVQFEHRPMHFDDDHAASNFRETCLGNYFWHCGASFIPGSFSVFFFHFFLPQPHNISLMPLLCVQENDENKKNYYRITTGKKLFL